MSSKRKEWEKKKKKAKNEEKKSGVLGQKEEEKHKIVREKQQKEMKEINLEDRLVWCFLNSKVSSAICNITAGICSEIRSVVKKCHC